MEFGAEGLTRREKGIARDIVTEAKSGYDCVVVGRRGMSKLKDLVMGIVIGRKGLSKVRDFFMGRVSNKVIHMAKEYAIWVVN